MYVDNRLKHGWVWKASMSAAGMAEVLEDQRANKFFPVRIGTALVDNTLRFSAIFAKSENCVANLPASWLRSRRPE